MYCKYICNLKYFLIFITTLALVSYPSISIANENLNTFQTQTDAQNHCPSDEVVWLNLPTGIWHTQGERWYGKTKTGAYVCKSEAVNAGDRESLNGQ